MGKKYIFVNPNLQNHKEQIIFKTQITKVNMNSFKRHLIQVAKNAQIFNLLRAKLQKEYLKLNKNGCLCAISNRSLKWRHNRYVFWSLRSVGLPTAAS